MEEVILVNEKDKVLGYMEKQEAHIKGLMHRAFSIFVFNDKNELLLQKRAIDKYHSGGLWTNTCCSHPRKNETNIEQLISAIKIKLKNKFITSDDILITRERHRQHLEQCVQNLENFENKNRTEDFDKAAEDLRLATRHLGIIVGKVDVEEILGSIFNDFCIGK